VLGNFVKNPLLDPFVNLITNFLASADTVAVINILFPDQDAVIPDAGVGGVTSNAAATGSTGVTETGSEYAVFPEILSISFIQPISLKHHQLLLLLG